MTTVIRDYTGVTTEQVAAEMLTEKVGHSLVDSGDYYGRNYEANRRKSLKEQPAATARFECVGGGDQEPDSDMLTPGKLHISATVDLYHWMVNHLEFDAELQTRLDEFTEELHPNTCWFEVANSFAEMLHETGALERAPKGPQNSCNWGASCELSQHIRLIELHTDDDYYASHLIIQGHGGCDVRSGYTAPRVFRVKAGDPVLWDGMRISGVEAGDDIWWVQGPDVQTHSMNVCDLDLEDLPTFELAKLLEVYDYEGWTTIARQGEDAKIRLQHTTLNDKQRQHSLEIVTANVERAQSAARAACVTRLAADWRWFVICDAGNAWLFNDEDREFSDGRQFKPFVD